MTQPVLLTLASADKYPLLDIDGTAFIQFGIFVVLALVSTQLLFKPYLKMREQRDAGMEGAREEAENLSAQADAKLVDYEEKLAAARARAQQERRKIRGEASEHLAAITAKARAGAQEAISAAHNKVTSESETARAELMPKVDALAGDIVSQLLGRKVS